MLAARESKCSPERIRKPHANFAADTNLDLMRFSALFRLSDCPIAELPSGEMHNPRLHTGRRRSFERATRMLHGAATPG